MVDPVFPYQQSAQKGARMNSELLKKKRSKHI